MRGSNLGRAVRWVGVLLVVGTIVGLAWAPPGQSLAQVDSSSCRLAPAKVSAPDEISLGQTVQVTLTLTADCPPEVSPVDVVLVLDVSSSMGLEGKLPNAQSAAHVFVDAMDLDQSRVGLVTFNHVAAVRVPLVGKAEAARLHEVIDSLTASGQTNISGAIDVAHQLLVGGAGTHRPAMVVLTDGVNTTPGADPVPVAAGRAKADGVTVATICAGGTCDPGLEPAASGPEYFFSVPDTSKLPELYRQLAGALQTNEVATLTVRDEIPDNMRYMDGSAVPAPTRVGRAPSAFLEWDFTGGMPAGGITYRLEPLEVGVHPTNVVATGRIVDRRGRPGQTTFPVPEVRVIKPPCIPQALDVYFLIDNSNCLYGAVMNGLPSLEAIRQGVDQVMGKMQMGRDRGAVIAFGDTAVLLQPLTSDRQAILDAVMAVAMRDDAARLDLAYAKVRRDLDAGGRRPNAQVATLFVTDGPMMPSLDLADQQAQLLRAQAVLNYGIGIGDLAQHALLRHVTEPGGYRDVDFGGDLIARYVELGAIIGPMGGKCVQEKPPTPTSGPATVSPTDVTPGTTATPGPSPTPTAPLDRSVYLPVAGRS